MTYSTVISAQIQTTMPDILSLLIQLPVMMQESHLMRACWEVLYAFSHILAPMPSFITFCNGLVVSRGLQKSNQRADKLFISDIFLRDFYGRHPQRVIHVGAKQG